MSKSKVTIKEIADMAGVSIATVSHVINRTRYVRPELVDKIEKIIVETGYQAKIADKERKLLVGRESTIVAVIPNIESTIYRDMVAYMKQIVSVQGYQFLVAITDMIWHIPNSAIVPMNSFLKSIFDTRSMSGRDNSMTIHEYTVISIPAFDSDMLNDFAMSVSKPIGINSDVLNMNAETVIPTSGSISFLVNLLFIFIPLPNNMWYI